MINSKNLSNLANLFQIFSSHENGCWGKEIPIALILFYAQSKNARLSNARGPEVMNIPIYT
jgi:hypothetical protein